MPFSFLFPWVLEIIGTAAGIYETHYEAEKSSSNPRLEVTISVISCGSVMCLRECYDTKVGWYDAHIHSTVSVIVTA